MNEAIVVWCSVESMLQGFQMTEGIIIVTQALIVKRFAQTLSIAFRSPEGLAPRYNA